MHERDRTPDDPNTYLIDEVEVKMTIVDDKITAESQSGSTGGKLKVADRDTSVQFALAGTGSDKSTVTLSRPQLDRLRTILGEIAEADNAQGASFDYERQDPRRSERPR